MSGGKPEIFVSVDVETSGPIPAEFSMLSIGACLTDDPGCTFEVELRPINDRFDPKALEVTGFSLERLEREGEAPADGMRYFRDWLAEAVGDRDPVFVGFNAPFDWSFVNYYFHRFLGSNPFGFAALDIKALYMGNTGCSWSDTRSSRMVLELNPETSGNHTALQDAVFQAELFRLIMDDRKR
jgi:DNA polymerase III epsilon subunit-like protein